MAAALKLFRHATTVLALGACLGFGPTSRVRRAGPHKQRRRSKSCDSSSPSRSGSLEEQGREIADLRRKLDETSSRGARVTQRAGGDAREAARGVGAGGRRGAPRADGAGRPPVPRARGADGDRGRVPGIDAHPGQRRGASDRRTRPHAVGQQLRPDRHGGQVRHLLDPGRGKRGRKQGRPHDLHGRAQPLQPRPAHADGGRRHARVHRGRLRLVGRRQPVPAPPRLRPVAEAHGRADLVDLLRPRSRAERDRPRGPECDLALPAGAVPLDDPVRGAAGPRSLRREPGPQHQRAGRQRGAGSQPGARSGHPAALDAGREDPRARGSWQLAPGPLERRRPRPAGIRPAPDPWRVRSQRDAFDPRRRRPLQRAHHLAAATRIGTASSSHSPAAGASAATSPTSAPWAARMPSTIP